MTKISKTFIAAALLFLVMGVLYGIDPKRFRAVNDSDSKTIPSSSRNQSVTSVREEICIQNVPWERPRVAVKGENWTFDLFTAPTIVKAEDGYSATLPWLRERQSVNFDIVSVDRKFYPLQFVGYFVEPTIADVRLDDPKYIFMLFNRETKNLLMVKLGQLIGDSVKVRSFEREKENGEIEGYPHLIVFDKRIDREVILTPKAQYDEAFWDIKLRAKKSGKELILSRIGEHFSVGEKNYTLEAVLFEKKLLKFSQNVGQEENIFSLPFGKNEVAKE